MEPPESPIPADPRNNLSIISTEAHAHAENHGKNSFANIAMNSTVPTPSPFQQAQEAVKARRTTHNGKPAVIFKSRDYYGIMTAECRRTIVGRFVSIRPQIDKIRSRFSELFSLKGSVKIGVYDNFNVLLEFSNEDDFNTIWFKRSVEINGHQMWFQKWSPDFKPEEDLPIAPVWALLPKLPMHLHNWNYLKQITSVVGTPLEMDNATRGRTRPSMAKVRVEVDLLKPLPSCVWVGDEDQDSPLKGFEQKIEYEFVPKFCKHCRKLGHAVSNCRVLERLNAKEKDVEEVSNGLENNSAEKLGEENKETEENMTTEKEEAHDICKTDQQNYDKGKKGKGVVNNVAQQGKTSHGDVGKQQDKERIKNKANYDAEMSNKQLDQKIIEKEARRGVGASNSGGSILQEWLQKIKKKKKKMPQKRTNIKIKVVAGQNKVHRGAQENGHVDRNKNDNDKGEGSRQNNEDIDELGSKTNNDIEQYQEEKVGNQESGHDRTSEKTVEDDKGEKTKEGTGDNLQNVTCESTSLPLVVSTREPINPILEDLNCNMLHSYNSQDVIGNTEEEDAEYNKKSFNDNKTTEEQDQESFVQQDLKETCDKNGVSPIRRGRNRQKKGHKDKMYRRTTSPSCKRKEKNATIS